MRFAHCCMALVWQVLGLPKPRDEPNTPRSKMGPAQDATPPKVSPAADGSAPSGAGAVGSNMEFWVAVPRLQQASAPVVAVPPEASASPAPESPPAVTRHRSTAKDQVGARRSPRDCAPGTQEKMGRVHEDAGFRWPTWSSERKVSRRHQAEDAHVE